MCKFYAEANASWLKCQINVLLISNSTSNIIVQKLESSMAQDASIDDLIPSSTWDVFKPSQS